MKGTIFVLAAAALGVAGMQPASAQYLRLGEPVYSAGIEPVEVMAIVRNAGLLPLTPPVWRRGRYVMRALDRRGQEFRLVVDSQFGEIISALPVVHGPYPDGSQVAAYSPPPVPGMADPRIVRADPPVMALPSDMPAVRMRPPVGAEIEEADDDAVATLPPSDAEPHVIMAPKPVDGPLASRTEPAATAPVARAKPAIPLPRPRPAEKMKPATEALASAAPAAPVPASKPVEAKPSEANTAKGPAIQPADDAAKSKLRL